MKTNLDKAKELLKKQSFNLIEVIDAKTAFELIELASKPDIHNPEQELPEVGEYVLVLTSGGDYYTAFMNKRKIFYNDNEEPILNVFGWFNLPDKNKI